MVEGEIYHVGFYGDLLILTARSGIAEGTQAVLTADAEYVLGVSQAITDYGYYFVHDYFDVTIVSFMDSQSINPK